MENVYKKLQLFKVKLLVRLCQFWAVRFAHLGLVAKPLSPFAKRGNYMR